LEEKVAVEGMKLRLLFVNISRGFYTGEGFNLGSLDSEM